jgi:hypothetical protein
MPILVEPNEQRTARRCPRWLLLLLPVAVLFGPAACVAIWKPAFFFNYGGWLVFDAGPAPNASQVRQGFYLPPAGIGFTPPRPPTLGVFYYREGDYLACVWIGP